MKRTHNAIRITLLIGSGWFFLTSFLGAAPGPSWDSIPRDLRGRGM
jgi:hypothetical protein